MFVCGCYFTRDVIYFLLEGFPPRFFLNLLLHFFLFSKPINNNFLLPGARAPSLFHFQLLATAGASVVRALI